MPEIETNIEDDTHSVISHIDNNYAYKEERLNQMRKHYDPLSKGYCYNPLTKQPYP